jgi:outer membrane protein assembly factor BamB
MKRFVLALMLATAPAIGATLTDTTVAFYHGAPDRTGNYIVPGLNWQSAGTVRRDQRFDGRIEGHIYAQPLYWHPPDAARGLIIATTENDLVYALDAATGGVVWRTALGHPVPRAALPCGNIDSLGITGTPVIDAARGTIYLDAMSDDRGAPQHLLFGLRLADGSVLSGFPIDVAAGLAARGIHFNAAAQNQRGALALLGGRVFVPYGGHAGDCGDFHGVIVGFRVDRPHDLRTWITRGPKGGIWAPAGLSEADGALYFSSGNTHGARDWQDGEGVFRVGPNLAHRTEPRTFFVPSNWLQLDEEDLDIGAVTPLPLTPPGSRIPLLLALGKDGMAYLLHRHNLGGLGGALASHPAAAGNIITAAAAYPVRDAVLVAFEARDAVCPNGSNVAGIGALAVTGQMHNRLYSAWCARLDGLGAPIVTTTDGRSAPIVWVVGAAGDDRLHGLRGDTGEEIYTESEAVGDGMTGLRRFATILVAAGHFYIAGDGHIFAFGLP